MQPATPTIQDVNINIIINLDAFKDLSPDDKLSILLKKMMKSFYSNSRLNECNVPSAKRCVTKNVSINAF